MEIEENLGNIIKIEKYLKNSLYPNVSSLCHITGMPKSTAQDILRRNNQRTINNRIKDKRLIIFDQYDFRIVPICCNSNIKPKEYKQFMYRYFKHYGDYWSAYKIALQELINVRKGKIKLGRNETITTRRYNKIFSYNTLNKDQNNISYIENKIHKNLILQRRSSNLLKRIL